MELKTFNIMPDSKLENEKIDYLTQALNIYKTLFQRIKDRDNNQNFISYEIVLMKDQPTFNFTVPAGIGGLFEKTILSVFPNVTVKEIEDPIQINPNAVKVMEYKNHFFLALKVDKRANWLNYLLEILPLMEENEKAIVQILSIPLHNDWSNDVQIAYKQFKSGEIPRKTRLDKKFVGEMLLKTTAGIVSEIHNSAIELMGGEPEKFDFYENERSQMLRDGGLNAESVQKAKYGGYNVQISIVLECKKERIPTILRGIETAFLSFDGDNCLIPRKVNLKNHFELVKKRKKSSIINNYFSSLELSRLLLLPNKTLQTKYKIKALNIQQTRIPNALSKDGLLLGYGMYKGVETNIYLPINNHDELCLPHCTIGGMGSGKTNGYGANILVESYLKGFGAVMLDPAKKEVSEQIRKIMNPDEYEIINIADLKPSFDFVESKYTSNPKSYLSNTVLSFFEDTLEGTTGQTERYLRAFIIAMQTTKLNEVFKIMEEPEYLEKVIKLLPAGIHKTTLEQYSKESDAKRMQIIKPIYNRFDQIMGDPFLNKCFNNTETLDFVRIFSEKKIFVIDLSTKDGLTKDQINVIGNLLMVKMSLAMYLRPDEKQDPFFVVIDEPHQFNKSSRIWQDLAVESRKWRIGFHFLFHYWKQIPDQARASLKNALPHYHIYATSKETWKEFADEVKPYDLDECMNIKLKHAINIIRANNESLPPIMCQMAYPPIKRLKHRLKIAEINDNIKKVH